MHKATQNRPSPVVHVQDLVLDPDIDNSLSQSLSYYGVTPASAPYPHHLFSPNRGTSREYSLSRELNARFSQLDDYTDSLSAAGDFSPPVKIRKQGERNEPEEIKDVGSLLTMDDETSLDTYINEIKEAEGGNGGMPVPLKKKTSKQKNGNNVCECIIIFKVGYANVSLCLSFCLTWPYFLLPLFCSKLT